MTRHSFRWENLVLGLIFLAAVGSWAVWKQDLLSAREFSLTAAGVLIVLGVIGVAATLWQARPAAAAAAPLTTEGETDEEAHPHA
ncbi:MAG: hypothetical protein JWP31_569 [Aeromicrobium sp.]|nr:hypothetical protein [Aeromicrobium sp.]